MSESSRQYYARHPEKKRQHAKTWYVKHRARILAKSERDRDPVANRARAMTWATANRDKTRSSALAWRKANPDKSRAILAARRARFKTQACACCTLSDFTAFYRKARGLEVDHIKPIALGGLHCIQNLQILTEEQHRMKTSKDLRAIYAARRTK